MVFFMTVLTAIHLLRNNIKITNKEFKVDYMHISAKNGERKLLNECLILKMFLMTMQTTIVKVKEIIYIFCYKTYSNTFTIDSIQKGIFYFPQFKYMFKGNIDAVNGN